MSGHVQSHACCHTPAVVSKGYQTKGDYATIAGMKTYVTGDASAKKGILYIYDIFGFFDQSLQGADILAHGDEENPYKVIIPDFFDGSPADISWYPPDNEEKGKKLGAFFQNQAAPPKTLERIPKVIEEVKAANPSIESFAVVGFCWGGKVATLASQKDTLFKSLASVHPAMVDAGDAPGVTIPTLVLPSSGEEKKDVEAFANALTVKHHVSNDYYEHLHGFMAARSNLENPAEKEAYQKGYTDVLNWFHDTM